MRFELEAFLKYFVLIVIAVLACFFLPATILNLLLSYGRDIPFWIPPTLTACVLIILGYVLYQGYARKQILYFSAVFSIAGIFLILTGLVIQLPYSAQEYFREDVKRDMNEELWLDRGNSEVSIDAYYVNGSPRIEIQPFETKTFFWWYDIIRWNPYYGYSAGYRNFPPYIPTLQIDIGTYEDLNFKLVIFSGSHSNIDEVLLNYTIGATWGSWRDWQSAINSIYWEHFFWMPKHEHYAPWGSSFGLIFKNPSNLTFVFSFKTTRIQASDGYRTVTKYKPPLQIEYAYAGLCLVSGTFILDSYMIMRKMRKKSIAQRL